MDKKSEKTTILLGISLPFGEARVKNLRNILILSLVLGIVTLSITFIHLRLFPYVNDDAYIHIRIAQNFANYGKPYYNLQEPVSGSSSPFWTILITILFKFINNSPIVISIFNSIVTSISVVSNTLLFYRLSGRSRGLFLSLLFGTCFLSIVLSSSISLMETSFGFLVFSIALHLLISNKRSSLILLSSLVFIRLEFAFFLILIVPFVYIRRIFRIKEIAFFMSTGVLPFLAYEVYFFKSVIPNTILAKSKVYDINYGNIYIYIFIVTIFVYVLLYLLHELTKNSDELTEITNIILIFGLLTFFFYVITKTLIFEWYAPIYLIPAVFGILSPNLIKYFRSKIVQKSIFVIGIALSIMFVFKLSKTYYSAFFNSPKLYEGFMTGSRVRKYISVGEELYKKYPNAALLTSEIGGLGYGFKGYIFDADGLISPDALKYHPMKVPQERSFGFIGAIPVKYIEEVNPGIIVSNDLFIESFLKSKTVDKYVHLSEAAFLSDDLRIANFQTIWNNSELSIFIRNDLYLTNR